MTKIIENKVKCKSCGDIIVSTQNGRKVSCSCGSTIIDGGLFELIREGNDFDELTKYFLND